jgi:GTP-binding protein EngB required for normal cell division
MTLTSFINICLVGCVSAGKSTILNALFGQDYAQCKIKRTTMMPNVFMETDNKSQIDTLDKINKTISEINNQIYTQTENGLRPLKLSDYGNELNFYVGNMDLNLGNKIKICMYDIPGLNDARTKQIYYDYLRNNFHKFNIVLFVVDINSGLNTSDEMDILNFLAENIKSHKTKSNKNINMLTIVNKADDMQLGMGDKLEVLGELGEMFDQTLRTIKQTFTKKGIESSSMECIPICGLDAHLYRMIKKYKDINKLSREHILKIGINDEGSKFRGLNEQSQRTKVQNIIQNTQFVDTMIKLSGFSQIENCLRDFIGIKGSGMVKENILWEYGQIEEMNLTNFIQVLKKKIQTLSKLQILDQSYYNDEMKKVIKQTNTIIYKKINTMKNPHGIKEFFDNEFVNKIKSSNEIKLEFGKFFNLDVYPSYFTDKILELVIEEFSNNAVQVSKLEYIYFFESIGNLESEVIDVILDSLMSNPRGMSTFEYNNYGSGFELKVIKLFEKIKKSVKFISFLRFFLANMYNSVFATKPEDLVIKKIIFKKYGEIPMYEFIQDLRFEKKNLDSGKSIKNYCQGIRSKTYKENLLELYYIAKCRESNDTDNFINHDIKITIDFDMMI